MTTEPESPAQLPQSAALTDAQITAGSNIMCDCPKPKRIGRNAAIDVFHAMTGTAPAGGVASAPVKTWRERIGVAENYPLHGPTDVERAMVAEIAELREAQARKLFPAITGAAFKAAVDGEYPIPDSPHASVVQRALDDRAVFRAGWHAARRIGVPQAGAVPEGEQRTRPSLSPVLVVPAAIMNIEVDPSQSDEYKRGHRDARHAASDLVLERADELAALAQLAGAQAARDEVRNQALDEAADACLRATPDRARVAALGESGHYSTCAALIRTLKRTPGTGEAA